MQLAFVRIGCGVGLLLLLVILQRSHYSAGTSQDSTSTVLEDDASAAIAVEDEASVARAQRIAEVETAIDAYVTAFNARDTETLASLWAKDGVYANSASEEEVHGREKIAAQFRSLLNSDEAPNLSVSTDNIELISPNVALESGTATVTLPDGEAYLSSYQVIYIKQDGGWLIDRVTEEDLPAVPSHYDQLKYLDWLIGDWLMEGDGYRVETTCDWTANNNFISRRFTVYEDEVAQSNGLQIIGWDAKEGMIRSWLFDSDGGVVEGEWISREDRWLVQSTATLADGSSGSFTSVFRLIDDNQFGWSKINRVVEDELLPNIDETISERQ